MPANHYYLHMLFFFSTFHCLDSQGSACEHSDLFKIALSVIFNVLDVTTMILLGQPHKRSVHISTFFFLHDFYALLAV